MIMTPEDFKKRLIGQRILWRPTFEDVSGTKQYEDLLVEDLAKGFVPNVWLHTEDRLPESVIPDDGMEFTSDNADDKIKRVLIEHVKEYDRLDGFSGVLHVPTDEAAGHMEPDLGRVVECRVICDTRDCGRITRTVIFVVAESLEFAVRFLIPQDIRVAAIYQENYHANFNGCRVAGGFMRRIARILGTRWYFSDSNGVQAVGAGNHDEEVFQAFPCIRDFSDVELYPIPDFGASSDSEVPDSDDVKGYIVGATFEEDVAVANIVQ